MATGGYDAVYHGEPGTLNDEGQIIPEGEFGETDTLKGLGAGAKKGAAAGANYGPWGAIIGGVLGGARGMFTSHFEDQKLREATKLATYDYIEEQGAVAMAGMNKKPSSVNQLNLAHAGGGANLNQTENLRYGGVDPNTQKLMGPVLPHEEITQNQGAVENLGGVNVNDRGFSSYDTGGTLDTTIPSDMPQNWG